MARVLRGIGWMLIGSGALVLLYVVYLLAFTTATTRRAQDDLLANWQAEVGALPVGGSAAGRADKIGRAHV